MVLVHEVLENLVGLHVDHRAAMSVQNEHQRVGQPVKMVVRSHEKAEVGQVVLVHDLVATLAVVEHVQLILVEPELVHVKVVHSLVCAEVLQIHLAVERANQQKLLGGVVVVA